MANTSILLVDDELIILESLGMDLRAEGYEVTSADSGENAIAALEKSRFDLVITDLMMEGLDGIQVLKRAKSIYPALPVIILTGYGDMTSAIDALRLGADDYLLKPCEIDELLFRISRCLEKQQLLEQLRLQNKKLQEEIASRTQAEEGLKENAEKIKRFAYSVSHDLKSPVIAMHGLTKRLQSQYRAALGEKGAQYCDRIVQTSEQILTLIESINAYMSAKETVPTIERVNLEELVRTIREEFDARLNARRVKLLKPERMPEINADKLSMLRVLRNLVDNALKYGGEGLSEITVGYEESAGFHTLYVKDNGIGVAEKDRRKIFNLFQRSLHSKGIEGAGLGLAIVQEIARIHGGEVGVKSGTNKGAHFYVTIAKELGR